jgi:DNA-binding MarR family transcriptional regulator
MVLRGHVGEQVQYVPARARGRAVQIVAGNGRDDVDGRLHGGSVERSKVRNSMHAHIVCVRISSVYDYASRMTPRAKRPDLAAMMGPLVREMMAAEVPVLEAHGLSMWGYIVLSALDRSPVRTQAALADAIGADKTRIIATLDDLQDRGYIERRPDPDDRRVRLLELTEAGRAAKDGAQQDIQRGEERWLGRLSADDRRVFLRVLRQLSAGDGGS